MEPWNIRIYDSRESLLLSAVITRTELTTKAVGDSWEGRAQLTGKVAVHGGLDLDEALVILVIFLVNREDDPDVDYWYIDDDDILVVRVEPKDVCRVLGADGAFNLDILLCLDVVSRPDGMSEQDVVDSSMDFIFSEIEGEVTDDGDVSDEPEG